MTSSRRSLAGESLVERLDAVDQVEGEIESLRRERWKMRTITVVVGVTAANVVWGLGAGWFTRVVAVVTLSAAAAWLLAWIFVERSAGRDLQELEGRRQQLGEGT